MGRASGKSGVKRFQNVRDFEKAGMTLKGRFSRAAAACFSWNRTYKGAVLSRSWKIGLPAWTILGKDLFLVEQGDKGKKKTCFS